MMLDHRQEGVRVSYIMPGSVDTEFGQVKADSGLGKKATSWKIDPADIAGTVMFLLRMPERTLISRVEVRPTKPGK